MQGPCHGPSECILPSFIAYHMPWKLQSIWYTLIALRCMPCNTHCRSVVHQSHKASGCCIGASPRPSILNQSHICQARHPTLTCGSFNHICSQLRLENQVSCGLHITATLSPGHQHAHTFEQPQHQQRALCDIFLWVYADVQKSSCHT